MHGPMNVKGADYLAWRGVEERIILKLMLQQWDIIIGTEVILRNIT